MCSPRSRKMHKYMEHGAAPRLQAFWRQRHECLLEKAHLLFTAGRHQPLQAQVEREGSVLLIVMGDRSPYQPDAGTLYRAQGESVA